MRLRTLFFGVLLGWMPFAWGQGEPALFWPTPNDAFYKGKGVESFIQPTAGNTVSSGLFGSVRNGGYRFHEGLDMKAVQRNRRERIKQAELSAVAHRHPWLYARPAVDLAVIVDPAPIVRRSRRGDGCLDGQGVAQCLLVAKVL